MQRQIGIAGFVCHGLDDPAVIRRHLKRTVRRVFTERGQRQKRQGGRGGIAELQTDFGQVAADNFTGLVFGDATAENDFAWCQGWP